MYFDMASTFLTFEIKWLSHIEISFKYDPLDTYQIQTKNNIPQFLNLNKLNF